MERWSLVRFERIATMSWSSSYRLTLYHSSIASFTLSALSAASVPRAHVICATVATTWPA